MTSLASPVSLTRLLLATAILCAVTACTLPVLPGSTPDRTTPADTSGPVYPTEEIRADFEQLYETLQVAHYDLYTNMDEADYDRYYQAYLDTLVQPMSRLEVAKRFQQFVALGRVAHARIDFPDDLFGAYLDAGGRVLPLFLVIEGDRVVVEEGYAPLTPGDEVVAVGGEPVGDWLRRLTQHLSADTPRLAHTLLEGRLPPLLWLEDGARESYEITVRAGQGEGEGDERTVTVPTVTYPELQALRAETGTEETAVDWEEREARMLDDEIAYLRPGPFYNTLQGGKNPWDTTAFHRFVDRSFRTFATEGAQALILDLRHNPGGTNSFSDHLLAHFATEPFRFASDFRVKISPQAVAANDERLPSAAEGDDSHQLRDFYAAHRVGEVASLDFPLTEPREEKRFGGQVYALIDRHSYSNAVTVAAMIQDYGFGRVLGEPTADLATTYGAMESFTLDHTGLVVGFPKAHIIRPNGDVNPGGVTPDEGIDVPFEAGASAAARDAAVLEAAADIVREDLSEEIR